MLIIQGNSWHSRMPKAAINKNTKVLSNPYHNSNLDNFMVNRYSFNRYSFAGKLSTIDILEDKNLSQEFMQNNLEKNKPLLGSAENSNLFFTNEKVANNFAIFMRNHAKEKLQLARNGSINLNQEQIGVFKELEGFFDDYLNEKKQNNKLSNISFKSSPVQISRKITQADEIECRKIINAHATACATSAALVGKASVSGVDAWVQRGIQTNMFFMLRDYLDVPASAAMIYGGTEFFSKAYVGMRAAQYINSIMGITADIAFGPASVPITESTTRGGNSIASFYLTRSMGINFVKQVKSRQMNCQNQLLRSGKYLSQKLIIGGALNGNILHCLKDIPDALHNGLVNGADITTLNQENILQDALEKVPDETKALFGQLTAQIIDNATERAPLIFLSNFLPPLIPYVKKVKNGEQGITAEQFKAIANEALLNTILTGVAYEVCDLSADALITDIAKHNYDIITQKIFEDPDIFKEFTKVLDDVSEKINLKNIGKIDSLEFINQFKDRAFIFEISRCIKQDFQELADKINKKTNNEFKGSLSSLNNTIQNTKQSEEKLTQTNQNPDVQKIDDFIKTYINKDKTAGSGIKTRGFANIAGYSNELAQLINSFGILAIDTENTLPEEYPNAILLYGPRGVGKTLMLNSAREQFGSPGIKKKLIGSKKECFNSLLKTANEQKIRYEKDLNKRQFFYIMDECTTFLSQPKNDEERAVLDKFNEFIKDCASKYHISLFMTTNHPDLIYKPILENAAIAVKMPVGIAKPDEIKEILQLYASKATTPIDYDLITNKILEKAHNTNRAFSNTDIKNIALCKMTANNFSLNKDKGITQEKILNTLKHTIPEITEDEIKEFNSIKDKI